MYKMMQIMTLLCPVFSVLLPNYHNERKTKHFFIIKLGKAEVLKFLFFFLLSVPLQSPAFECLSVDVAAESHSLLFFDAGLIRLTRRMFSPC